MSKAKASGKRQYGVWLTESEVAELRAAFPRVGAELAVGLLTRLAVLAYVELGGARGNGVAPCNAFTPHREDSRMCVRCGWKQTEHPDQPSEAEFRKLHRRLARESRR